MKNALSDKYLRARLAIYGIVAGLFFYILSEYLDQTALPERALLLISIFALSFFGSLLLLTGPVRALPATIYAGIIATITAFLVLWASFRFASSEDFLSQIKGTIPLAVIALTLIPLPFLISYEQNKKQWRDYEHLFDHAWSIAVRLATATCFLAIFWAVLFLSNTMLKLVRVDMLDDLIKELWFDAPISGLVFGLGLAVLHEMTSTVKMLRHLALRLLQLLLPLVTLIVAIFLARVPFRGIAQLFGESSAFLIIMIVTIGSVSLISAAIDGNDDDAAKSFVLTLSTKILALFIPLLAALATYAIWLRIAQYGLTPARIFSALAALVTLSYGVLYGSAIALRRSHWRASLRRGNVIMAFALTGLAALWLTPALNAQSFSARNQLERFNVGKTALDALDLWSLDRNWGLAGKAAIAELENQTDNGPLQQQIAELNNTTSQYALDHPYNTPFDAQKRKQIIAQLAEKIPVRAAGASLNPSVFTNLTDEQLFDLEAACQTTTASGTPGCLAIIANLLPNAEDEVLLFSLVRKAASPNPARLCHLILQNKEYSRAIHVEQSCTKIGDTQATIYLDQLASGQYKIGSADIFQINLDAISITPRFGEKSERLYQFSK